MNKCLYDALKAFNLSKTDGIIPFGTGHINETYRVKKGENYYILQMINGNVFHNPFDIMDNVIPVCSHIKDKLIKTGKNPNREALTFLKAIDGSYYYLDMNNNLWRLMEYVSDTVSFETCNNSEMFKKCGIAFGNFISMLSDFPAEILHEVIKDFHNTPVRVNQLEKAISENISGRLNNVSNEIEFALSRKTDAAELINMLSEGKLPLKVTHNDTKIGNILLDKNSLMPICVIDLDTVMPGLVAYDFGDSIRAGASTAVEDESDLLKVNFDLSLFRAYSEGFIEATGNTLSDYELYSLPIGAKLMTYECGIRFLADYLNGDTYYKIDYPEHNLVRARNQFKLVLDMEKKMNEMHSIINELADRR